MSPSPTRRAAGPAAGEHRRACASRERLPLVLVGDGDIGGLIGIPVGKKTAFPTDRVDRRDRPQEFDFIDIGELLPASGAVPVVIKSLVLSRS